MKKTLLLLLVLMASLWGYGQQSSYCGGEFRHLGIAAEVNSGVFLTIENTGASTMEVTIESAIPADSMDLLLITGGSGAALGTQNTSVPGQISQELSWTGTPPDTVVLNVLWSKQSFGGNWQLSPTDVKIPFTASCAVTGKMMPDLPITFEDTATVEYELNDFNGTSSQIVVDPTDPTNLVVETLKGATAAFFAGTTAGDSGLVNPVPFAMGKTKMTVRVWSPDAGIPVRLKVENSAFGATSVETEAMTTMAGMWETLEFDFLNNVTSTPALNLDSTYDKVTIFFNFGTDGATAGAKTYYWDDIEFVNTVTTPPLPAYCDTQVFHMMNPVEVNSSIFLTVQNTGTQSMRVTVESVQPADTVDELVIPFASGAAVGPKDFSVPGQISIDLTWAATPPDTVTLNILWSKLSLGGNWQFSPTDFKVLFNSSCAVAKVKPDLPITFEDTATVDYDLVDFNGNASQIVVDPTNSSNLVVQTDKGSGAQATAGTIASDAGLASPLPFASNATRVTARVWSPDAGIPVRMKVENTGNGGIFVEAEDTTTMAGMWETLEFDFSNSVSAPLDLNATYDKVVIFFNFGTDGATAGAKTYYWDDVDFAAPVGKAKPDLPLTFEDTATVDYNLGDFGGNASQIVVDPTNAANLVVESVKGATAQDFAGTTAGNDGLEAAIPFTPTKTRMRARVWSPDSGIVVKMKVENADDGNISVETDAMTTMAGMWETLEFDFNNNSANTPAINFSSTYDKVSMFFNFGVSGQTAGAKTYYWDDVTFVDSAVPLPLPEYCNTEVFHLGIPAEVPSAIFLTIENTGPQSMKVTIESANSDSVDFLLVNGGSGAAVGAEDFSVAGQISRDLTWTGTPPDTVTLNVLWSKQSFGGNWQLSPNDIQVLFNTVCVPPPPKPDLPITFEDTVVDYNLADFAGTASQIVQDPTDPANMVAQTIKGAGAQDFAGTVAGADGLENDIPFTLEKSRLEMRVWSPDANIPVRIKVENRFTDQIFAEAEATTTVAGQWENLTFNFLTPPAGAPGLDLNETYGKIIVFFNFGVDGPTAGGDKTYYWDDVTFDDSAIEVIQPTLPVTFEDPALGDYNLGDFEGTFTQLVVDPTDASNTVAETTKGAGAATFAGTVIGAQGLASPVPFATEKTRMTVRVWSPDANIPVRLKVENSALSSINSEAETFTTVASQWETLTFNFATPAAGGAVDTTQVYDKAIIFFNFGVDGATAGAKTYYWDDVTFIDSVIPTLKPDLPITFEDPALGDYDLADFEGTFSQIVIDPTNAANQVVQTIRGAGSATFAGTVVGEFGLANPIPFTATETKMSVAVWSPDANIPVRLKVENSGSAGISVETEDTTNVAQGWEYLVFDFANQVDGTPAFDPNATYDKATIFFNFGVEGSAAGEQTFYWDNVSFGDSSGVVITSVSFVEDGIAVYPNPAQDQLTVQFEALPMQPVRVSLYDLNGRLVKQTTVQSLTNVVELGDLPNGMYLFLLESKEGIFRQKVTVRR